MSVLYPADIIERIEDAIDRCAIRKSAFILHRSHSYIGGGSYAPVNPNYDARQVERWDSAIRRLEHQLWLCQHPGKCEECGMVNGHHSDCWTLQDHTPVKTPTMESVARRLLGR